MQFLYYLLLLLVGLSALIAILMAAGVLHIEVYNSSDPNDLPDEVRDLLDENEDNKEEQS